MVSSEFAEHVLPAVAAGADAGVCDLAVSCELPVDGAADAALLHLKPWVGLRLGRVDTT